MRKVATRLGVGAMSLYTYVPGRDELLELMVNRVHAELDLPADDLPWRASVEQQVGERWRMYERHPWLLELNMARMPIGPHVLDADEALYAAVFRAGLRGTDVVSTTNLIVWQLLGAARSQIIESDEARRTGTSAEAYWDSRASFWETYFDYRRYPTMAAVWEAGGFDDDQAYAFDRLLSRLLDGLESSLDPSLEPLSSTGASGAPCCWRSSWAQSVTIYPAPDGFSGVCRAQPRRTRHADRSRLGVRSSEPSSAAARFAPPPCSPGSG